MSFDNFKLKDHARLTIMAVWIVLFIYILLERVAEHNIVDTKSGQITMIVIYLSSIGYAWLYRLRLGFKILLVLIASIVMTLVKLGAAIEFVGAPGALNLPVFLVMTYRFLNVIFWFAAIFVVCETIKLVLLFIRNKFGGILNLP